MIIPANWGGLKALDVGMVHPGRGLLIVDGDARSELSDNLRSRTMNLASAKGHSVETLEVGRDELPPCIGCLECLTKRPGSCVYDKAFRHIAEKAASASFVVFLASSSFGNPSSAIKNLMDRGGLIVKDSATRQIVIGYGEEASAEEASTFVDAVAKHRGRADVVHPNLRETIEVFFTRSPKDNERIAETLADSL
jgi:hypothetical protein